MADLSRRQWLAAASAGLLQAGQPAASARPNILFIMVDEMRWDAMRCAGHPVVDTPNLDRLAKQGMRFANSYTVAPVCSPARTAAFTGRYAQVAGVTTNAGPSNPSENFMP